MISPEKREGQVPLVKKDQYQDLVTDAVLARFRDPETLPKVVELAELREPDGNSWPCDKWSIHNRMVMLFYGTEHARGPRQWEKLNRKCEPGKSFSIYVPAISGKKHEGCGGKVQWDRKAKANKCLKCGGQRIATTGGFLIGFNQVKVWAAENTTGDGEIPAKVEPPVVRLPLLEAAKGLGVSVNFEWFNGQKYGSFNPATDTINLATHEEITWFHELAHAAHKKVLTARKVELKGGQDPRQEIVAELAGAALCLSQGREDTLRNSYEYITHYAQQENLSPIAACMQVLSDVKDVLRAVKDSGTIGWIKALAGK